MDGRHLFIQACLLLNSVAAFAAAPLVQGAPTASKGFETLGKQVVDLDREIPGMQGRQLRLRLLSIAPGGHIKVHSHKNRPATFYVIQGATTVVYDDGTARRFPAGTMGHANGRTTHWHQNNGKVPAVFVAADVFQPVPR